MSAKPRGNNQPCQRRGGGGLVIGTRSCGGPDRAEVLPCQVLTGSGLQSRTPHG